MSIGFGKAMSRVVESLQRNAERATDHIANRRYRDGFVHPTAQGVDKRIGVDQHGRREIDEAGEGLRALEPRWPAPLSGVLAPRPEVLAPHPVTDRLSEYHTRKPEVKWSPLKIDSPFPAWARSDTEDSMPALTRNLELSCIDMPLYAATESGALTRAQVRALYSRGDSAEEYNRWCEELPGLLTPHGRQEFVADGPRPRRGDLVFLYGSMLHGAPEKWVHAAVATGRVDPLGSPVLHSFYRDPENPLSRGKGWGGTVTRETMSSLSKDWNRTVAGLRAEFGPGPW
ncbi:hypothetical protein [Nocardia gipuzkoensis]|uniref:hypothetical protein n=1 Tax=Nocardia gipuzkoensis TaxID=2749991 RepID=UPI00237D8096|nr:hypothetical protein [Nocardia gipuzkoensis]MDE1675153.1 hypothetical protein [Nocardia gipuzkoensis]